MIVPRLVGIPPGVEAPVPQAFPRRGRRALFLAGAVWVSLLLRLSTDRAGARGAAPARPPQATGALVMRFVFVFLAVSIVGQGLLGQVDARGAAAPPNIVWIVGEDLGPELRCYGDEQAITPNLDRLAREGVRLHPGLHACPGLCPQPLRADHRAVSDEPRHPPHAVHPAEAAADVHGLPARGRLPVCWPTRTPFGKTDFNFAVPPAAFDVVTDWTRAVPRDRPFFGFFNITTSHESQIRPAPQMARNLASFPPMSGTTRPGSASRPIIRTRRWCDATWPTTTTW